MNAELPGFFLPVMERRTRSQDAGLVAARPNPKAPIMFRAVQADFARQLLVPAPISWFAMISSARTMAE